MDVIKEFEEKEFRHIGPKGSAGTHRSFISIPAGKPSKPSYKPRLRAAGEAKSKREPYLSAAVKLMGYIDDYEKAHDNDDENAQGKAVERFDRTLNAFVENSAKAAKEAIAADLADKQKHGIKQQAAKVEESYVESDVKTLANMFVGQDDTVLTRALTAPDPVFLKMLMHVKMPLTKKKPATKPPDSGLSDEEWEAYGKSAIVGVNPKSVIDVEGGPDKGTPLIGIIASMPKSHNVEHFLDTLVSPHDKNKHEKNKGGHYKIEDKDDAGHTFAMQQAIRHGHMSIIEHLLAINAKFPEINSAMSMAIESGMNKVVNRIFAEARARDSKLHSGIPEFVMAIVLNEGNLDDATAAQIFANVDRNFRWKIDPDPHDPDAKSNIFASAVKRKMPILTKTLLAKPRYAVEFMKKMAYSAGKDTSLANLIENAIEQERYLDAEETKSAKEQFHGHHQKYGGDEITVAESKKRVFDALPNLSKDAARFTSALRAWIDSAKEANALDKIKETIGDETDPGNASGTIFARINHMEDKEKDVLRKLIDDKTVDANEMFDKLEREMRSQELPKHLPEEELRKYLSSMPEKEARQKAIINLYRFQFNALINIFTAKTVLLNAVANMAKQEEKKQANEWLRANYRKIDKKMLEACAARIKDKNTAASASYIVHVLQNETNQRCIERALSHSTIIVELWKAASFGKQQK